MDLGRHTALVVCKTNDSKRSFKSTVERDLFLLGIIRALDAFHLTDAQISNLQDLQMTT